AVGHGRALQVPARPPAAVGGVPGRRLWLARLRVLPQREVVRVALVARLLLLEARHVLQPLAGEAAVLGEGTDVEVDVGALAPVGVPALDEPVDESDHLGHVPGGARLVGGAQHADGVVGGRELMLEAVGPRTTREAGIGRTGTYR